MFKKMDLLSKIPLQIIAFLGENPSKRFYEREIAKNCKISTGAVNNYMGVLKAFNVVEYEKRGKTSLYRINLEESIPREFRALLNLLKLHEFIKDIKSISKKAILFGSYSDGTSIEGSDIDLFVISSDRKAVMSLVSKTEKGLGTKINPIIADSSSINKLKDEPIYKNIQRGKVLWESHEY